MEIADFWLIVMAKEMAGEGMNGRDGQQKKETNIDELRYIRQIYQNQYTEITSELEAKVMLMKELDMTQRSLESISEIEGKNTLMPIGYDVYLNAHIEKNNHALIGVGAGCIVDKSIDEAKGYIAKAVEKETKSLNNLMRAKKEVESALIEVSYKIEESMHA